MELAQPILGPHLEELKTAIPALARSSEPLLIVGEEGVGKTLLARHINAASATGNEPLPHVNLSTSSEREGRLSLLGSDFAKLTSTKRSLLERHGNVLIEHIDAASLSLHADVANAFRAGQFLRPGAVRKASVNCRPIFTLREHPQAYLERGSLAPELFQMLNSLRTVVIPPLRERPGDISAIARHMLGRYLTPELEQLLLADPWPGNATELKVHLLCIRPFTGRGGPPEECLRSVRKVIHRLDEGRHVSVKESISALESAIVAYALRCTDGHKTRAAELLGMTPAALRRHIEKSERPS